MDNSLEATLKKLKKDFEPETLIDLIIKTSVEGCIYLNQSNTSAIKWYVKDKLTELYGSKKEKKSLQDFYNSKKNKITTLE